MGPELFPDDAPTGVNLPIKPHPVVVETETEVPDVSQVPDLPESDGEDDAPQPVDNATSPSVGSFGPGGKQPAPFGGRRRLNNSHSPVPTITGPPSSSIQLPSFQTIGIVSAGLILLGFVAHRIIRRFRNKPVVSRETDIEAGIE